MIDFAFLIPLSPLIGFLILFTTLGRLPKPLVAIVGVGSVGVSAVIVALMLWEFLLGHTPQTATIYTWIDVGGFTPRVSFYIDGLTLTMMSVITGVGFQIHLY